MFVQQGVDTRTKGCKKTVRFEVTRVIYLSFMPTRDIFKKNNKIDWYEHEIMPKESSEPAANEQ